MTFRRLITSGGYVVLGAYVLYTGRHNGEAWLTFTFAMFAFICYGISLGFAMDQFQSSRRREDDLEIEVALLRRSRQVFAEAVHQLVTDIKTHSCGVGTDCVCPGDEHDETNPWCLRVDDSKSSSSLLQDRAVRLDEHCKEAAKEEKEMLRAMRSQWR